LGIERCIPVLFDFDDRPQTFLFVLRLGAFLLILAGIVNKNRGPRSGALMRAI